MNLYCYFVQIDIILINMDALLDYTTYSNKFQYIEHLEEIKEHALHNITAKSLLGICYKYGYGVPVDTQKASEYIEETASKNCPVGQYELADFYYYGYYPYDIDYGKAFHYCMLAHIQGHPTACAFLGFLYEKGEGMTKDESKALEYYKMSSEDNDPRGHVLLGLSYSYGMVVPRDKVKAFEYLKKASEQKYHQSFKHLGRYYQKGIGVAKNAYKALHCFLNALKYGNSSMSTKYVKEFCEAFGQFKVEIFEACVKYDYKLQYDPMFDTIRQQFIYRELLSQKQVIQELYYHPENRNGYVKTLKEKYSFD
jgi:TPR repeat protein